VNQGPSRRAPEGELAPPSLEHLLSSQEVAAILRVPVRTLDHYAFMRIGPRYFKIGKHRRYHPQDVQAWLAGQLAD
jgi:hypothetical protein